VESLKWVGIALAGPESREEKKEIRVISG
jgi:hypothetical protein